MINAVQELLERQGTSSATMFYVLTEPAILHDRPFKTHQVLNNHQAHLIPPETRKLVDGGKVRSGLDGTFALGTLCMREVRVVITRYRSRALRCIKISFSHISYSLGISCPH